VDVVVELVVEDSSSDLEYPVGAVWLWRWSGWRRSRRWL